MHRHMYRSPFYTLPRAGSCVSRGCIPEADAFDLSKADNWAHALPKIVRSHINSRKNQKMQHKHELTVLESN